LYDRSVLITGEVDRVTGFEKGFPVHQAWRGQSWEPDPLILDDQALIAHVAGRGLVVLTGCGHAGIINICRYAQRLTGVENLHAIIGGFHLTPPAVRASHRWRQTVPPLVRRGSQVGSHRRSTSGHIQPTTEFDFRNSPGIRPQWATSAMVQTSFASRGSGLKSPQPH